MKSLSFFALLFFVNMSLLFSQEPQLDFVSQDSSGTTAIGKWDMSIHTPIGVKHAVLLINDDYTGMLSEKPIEVDQVGNTIKYKSSRYSWMGTMYMDNIATIENDILVGKSIITKGPMKGSDSEWTAVRIKD